MASSKAVGTISSITHTSDQRSACTPSHTHRLFDAVAAADKSMQTITGATHYYSRQAEHLGKAVMAVKGWLAARDF